MRVFCNVSRERVELAEHAIVRCALRRLRGERAHGHLELHPVRRRPLVEVTRLCGGDEHVASLDRDLRMKQDEHRDHAVRVEVVVGDELRADTGRDCGERDLHRRIVFQVRRRRVSGPMR